MTKQEHIDTVRLRPIGAEGIEKLRRIVAEHQAEKVNEVFVDGFSASAMVQVFDALNEKNRDLFLKLTVSRAATVAFKLLS